MNGVANLNKFRKAKARAERRAQADQNAVSYGRSKAEKQAENAQRALAESKLDGKRLDKPDE